MILAGCCGDRLAVVIGRAAPLRVGNNTVIILLLKDLCCIGSLASQAALRDRLIGTGADKHGAANYRGNMHGITRTFTRTGFHRMSSFCIMGATASGGVTFMRVFSSLIPIYMRISLILAYGFSVACSLNRATYVVR